MKVALSVWFVALSCCVNVSNCGRDLPHILSDGRADPTSATLKEVSIPTKGVAEDVARRANTTSTVNQSHALLASSLTARARSRQEQSHSSSLPVINANKLRRLGRGKLPQHRQDAGKHNGISEGKHDKHQLSLLERQHSEEHLPLASLLSSINVGKPEKNSKDELDKDQANSKALLESSVGTLKEVSNATKGAAKDVMLKTNTTPTLSQTHAQFLNNVNLPARPRQEQSNSTTLLVIKGNQLRHKRLHTHLGRRKMTQRKHKKEQSSLHAGQHSHVGKLDKSSKDEHDKEQADSTALLESREGNILRLGAGSMIDKESREKYGNKDQRATLSDAMPQLPAGVPVGAGVMGVWGLALWIAGVVGALLCCSCCLFAQERFREKDPLEGWNNSGSSCTGTQDAVQDSQDSEDLEADGANQGTSSFSSFISKGKKARRAPEDSKYKFGDITSGIISQGKKARGVPEDGKYKFGDVTRGFINRKQNDGDET